jgi:hypothetical protein
MKIKDLLQFNPDAELRLLGTDYIPIDLSIYGWSSPDTNEDTKNITTEVLVIPTGLENKYIPETQA